MAGFDAQLAWEMRRLREASNNTRNRFYRIGDFLENSNKPKNPKHIPEPISAKVHISCIDGRLVRD